jgi:hypothetical protein
MNQSSMIKVDLKKIEKDLESAKQMHIFEEPKDKYEKIQRHALPFDAA